MLVLVTAHAVAAVLAPLLVRWLGTRAFYPLAAVPAVTAVYAGWESLNVYNGAPPTESFLWIQELQIELAFRMDTLAWLMTLIVSAVGALVLLYCAHYFEDKERTKGLGLFAGSLTAFAGAMLGLVTSDDLLMLYVFWELTTVLSYLLIGYVMTSKASVAAAKQALIVTTFGGLAMLVGMIMLGETQGTYRISELLENPGSGPLITTGVVLVLVGAVSKSALVPFHFWLPGAMAAPTPVSAYLHAAAMVKAGVYLVARFAPGYADLDAWRYSILILGGATMLVGGYRSLRQHDLKLLLAYGTVSQLGFITLMVGFGTRGTMLAGLALLVGHSLFKSCLFLTVGTIEHATGTRDVRRLSGIGRRMPVLATAGVLAALSMAGFPPVLGFAGKEAALASLIHPGAGLATFEGAALVVIAFGSVLTFAYSLRFMWGAFARKDPQLAGDSGPVTEVAHPPQFLLVAVPLLLALAGLALGPFVPVLETAVGNHTLAWPETEHAVHLALWHGVTPALVISVVIWILGTLLFLGSAPVAALQRAMQFPVDAGRSYQSLMRWLDRVALEVTGGFQRGSLPTLLAIILLVTVTLPGIQLIRGVAWPSEVRWFDSPAQMGVGIVVVVAAIATVRARRRLRAVFLVSVTGYGTALLFLLQGAPDLALTQALVETVTLVVFILVLRRLSGRFPDDPSVLTRRMRGLLGVAVGAVVGAVALVASAARSHDPAGIGLPESAVEYGGGYNIVNVILVDVRAWDTMGELSVVLAAATGVTSLIFLKQDAVVRARRKLRQTWRDRPTTGAEDGGSLRWIAAGSQHLDPSRRSTIFEVVTRLIFHTILVWSIYLLFSGHNAPGGGFAAGLVAGLALTLRYLAGRGYELRVALPVMPGLLLGGGLFLAAGSAILPMLFGSPPLRSWVFDVPIPLVGDVHVTTSLLFDVGVFLVVVGLMLDILRSLGSALDDQMAEEESR